MAADACLSSIQARRSLRGVPLRSPCAADAPRRSLVKPPCVSKLVPQFYFEPPRRYPYRTARRAEEPDLPRPGRGASRPEKPEKAPPLPNQRMAEYVVGAMKGGLPELLARARAFARRVRCDLCHRLIKVQKTG